MPYCEHADSCPIKSLLQQRCALMADRYQTCQDVAEGPDEIDFVEPLMEKVGSITAQISQLDQQMKAIKPCNACEYDNLELAS